MWSVEIRMLINCVLIMKINVKIFNRVQFFQILRLIGSRAKLHWSQNLSVKHGSHGNSPAVNRWSLTDPKEFCLQRTECFLSHPSCASLFGPVVMSDFANLLTSAHVMSAPITVHITHQHGAVREWVCVRYARVCREGWNWSALIYDVRWILRIFWIIMFLQSLTASPDNRPQQNNLNAALVALVRYESTFIFDMFTTNAAVTAGRNKTMTVKYSP